MNKNELKIRISKLPLFEKRAVQVNNTTPEGQDWTKQLHTAITEINGQEAYAYVHPGYALLQFKDVFNPILDQIPEEVDGFIATWKGYAFMKLFPQTPALQEKDTQFGIMTSNSVDYSSSINIKFVVRYGETYYTLPAKIAGFRKTHTQSATKALKDYQLLLTSVRAHWKTIVNKFGSFKIMDEPGDEPNALKLKDVMEQLKLGKKLTKKIENHHQTKTLDGKAFTLWDLFTTAANEVSNTRSKSDVHRERKIEKICNTIITYANTIAL